MTRSDALVYVSAGNPYTSPVSSNVRVTVKPTVPVLFAASVPHVTAELDNRTVPLDVNMPAESLVAVHVAVNAAGFIVTAPVPLIVGAVMVIMPLVVDVRATRLNDAVPDVGAIDDCDISVTANVSVVDPVRVNE